MKRDTKQMYATMPPWRLFFVVALPGMISMLAMSIYIIIEGAFIGQVIGEQALAAVNIAFPIIMINFSLSDLIGVGAAVPISVALGRRDEKSANNLFSCALVMIFAVSVIMGAIMIVAAEPLAVFMSAEGELIPICARYIRIYAIFSPITAIFFATDNFLKISGFVKTSMIINIFCNVATVGLLVTFLLVAKMDVTGSALASCIAMATCSFITLIPFICGRALLKFTRPRFSWNAIRQIIFFGAPVFLNNIAGRLTAILINNALMTLGASQLGENGGVTAVAAYSVLMYAVEICRPLMYGMSDSLAPSIGFNWGAGRRDRVKSIARCNYIGSLVLGFVSTALVFIFSRQVALIFVDSGDEALLALSEHALRLFCISFLFLWFIVTTQSLLSAIEKPLAATVLSVSLALFFPAASLFAMRGMGLDGVWLNYPVTCALSCLLGAVLLLLLKLKRKGKQPEGGTTA